SNDAAKDLVGHMTDVTIENTTVKETTDADVNGQPETAASVAATTAATTSTKNGATTSITTQRNITQTNAVNEQDDAPPTILNKGTDACAYVYA
ncbi:hypothetical protein, partial [Salmonella enterica]|uniref:hypothetical protein n=1 Tax=Salmonella enterica TaxID=28901 RepID=UPI0020C43D8F